MNYRDEWPEATYGKEYVYITRDNAWKGCLISDSEIINSALTRTVDCTLLRKSLKIGHYLGFQERREILKGILLAHKGDLQPNLTVTAVLTQKYHYWYKSSLSTEANNQIWTVSSLPEQLDQPVICTFPSRAPQVSTGLQVGWIALEACTLGPRLSLVSGK